MTKAASYMYHMAMATQKVYIDDDLHAQAKAAAALLRMPLRFYVENALRIMVDADLGDPEAARASVGLRPKRRRNGQQAEK